MEQRKTIYEGKPEIKEFMNWVVDEFLNDLNSIAPWNLFISEDLSQEITKNMTGFSDQFLFINKGPKMLSELNGCEVIYNEEVSK